MINKYDVQLTSWGKSVKLRIHVDEAPPEDPSPDSPGDAGWFDVTKIERADEKFIWEDISSSASDEEWAAAKELAMDMALAHAASAREKSIDTWGDMDDRF